MKGRREGPRWRRYGVPSSTLGAGGDGDEGVEGVVGLGGRDLVRLKLGADLDLGLPEDESDGG